MTKTTWRQRSYNRYNINDSSTAYCSLCIFSKNREKRKRRMDLLTVWGFSFFFLSLENVACALYLLIRIRKQTMYTSKRSHQLVPLQCIISRHSDRVSENYTNVGSAMLAQLFHSLDVFDKIVPIHRRTKNLQFFFKIRNSRRGKRSD